MLNDIEMKLLRLALNKGAFAGESDNAAVMFIHKLRERNINADDLFVQPNIFPHYSTNFNNKDYADGYYTMPFGKYKGEYLEDIPTSYLIWVLENCHSIKLNLRNAIENIIYGD